MSMKELFVPNHFYIELTNRCNMRCKHCYLAANPKGNLTLSSTLVKKALDEFTFIGGLSVTLSGGEPFLHPNCLDIAEYARALGLNTVLVTNGSLLNRDTIEHCVNLDITIALSLDGVSDKTNDAVRGLGSFAAARKSLDLLASSQQYDRTIICFTPTRQNVDELMFLVRMLEQRGFCRCYISLLEKRGRGLTHAEELSLTTDDQVCLLIQLVFLLSDPSLRMYIDAGHLKYFFLRLLNNWKDEGDPIEGTLRMSPSGKVYLTAYSDDERFLLGNFNSGNLRQLLRSSAIRNLFREINEHSAGSPRCKDCSSWAICGGGSRVRAYAMHKSFDEPDEFCEAKRVFLGRWFRALLEGV